MNTLCQIVVFILGGSSIWILGRKEKWSRIGYILGLSAQPFWIGISLHTHQYILIPLTLIYTYCWGQGVYNHWIKKTNK